MEWGRSYKNRKKILFLFFIKKKNIESLLLFNFDLPKVDKYYTDGYFAYSNVYGEKASQKNLNLLI